MDDLIPVMCGNPFYCLAVCKGFKNTADFFDSFMHNWIMGWVMFPFKESRSLEEDCGIFRFLKWPISKSYIVY